MMKTQFTLSFLVLVLAATTNTSRVAASPLDEGETLNLSFNNAQLAGFGKEYDEYCCDDFDRKAPNAGHHRVLKGCVNEGVMSACFCGLLQDFELRDDSDSDSDHDAVSTRDDGSNQNTGTLCVNGWAGEYPCDNVNLLSHLPLRSFDSDNSKSKANDVWGWSHTDDQGTRREFALIGLTDGTGMVEITDPLNPIVLGLLDTTSGNSLWRDIKVYRNYAYVVSEKKRHGLQIFDLTKLLTASQTSFTHFGDDVTTTWGAFRAHNIIIDEDEDTGFAYLAGVRQKCRTGALYMIDISNPTNPVKAGVGCVGNSYTHDAQCVVYHGPDTTYQGHEICFLCNTDHVAIFDVSDKNNPESLSNMYYDNAEYTHQGWLSPDHTHFVFGDELDETFNNIDTTIFSMDVTDLDNPGEPGSYVAVGKKAIDHNLYIKSFGTTKKTDIIFLANYQAGMRIMKVNDYDAVGPSDETTGFEEIGYFDTHPASDSPNFNGVWSVYPFFESGTVIASSIEGGLFILRPDISDFLPDESEPPSQTPILTLDDWANFEDTFTSGGDRVRTQTKDGRPTIELQVRVSGNPEGAAPYIESRQPLDVDGYCRIEIDLSLYTERVDRNSVYDGLLIQYWDGSDWQRAEFLNRGDKFFSSNGQWYDNLIIEVDVTGLSSTQLRFINTSNRRGERINLDHITAIAYDDCPWTIPV